ncbi:MAG: YtxH domain-containing protein [Anaerolineae bacterium]|nr:MAG: YtxH domain-containing protein [Anaerolineae bacterium]
MRKMVNFLSGALLGAAVGALVATLLAPAPGPELQNELRSRVENIQIEVRRAAEERRRELEEQLANLRGEK